MIEVRGLTKRYGDRAAVLDLGLLVPRGRIAVVMGPSGCGKTTVLRLIAGLERPDAGVIAIDGRVLGTGRGHQAHHRGLGLVFQDLALWPHLRVREHVDFGLRGPRPVRRERTAEVLERLSIRGLAERYPHQLSGGERQRLAIARALAPGHRCLLMDEPFSSLDPILKSELLGLVRGLCVDLGTTVIYVTHDLDEALALGERIFLMHRGRLVGERADGDLSGLTREGLFAWYRTTLAAAT
jgi:ABC-type Fe3+/spermidine/putrescine transport system ATPase subunit